MPTWGKFGAWPGKKRRPGGGAVVPPPSAGFIQTNLVKPGIAVNEYSGLTWGSGSAGQQTPSGAFERWRGRADDMICTHSDNNQDALELWQFREDKYHQALNWKKHIDLAIGAFGKDYNGDLPSETWKAAGRGDYDARWIATLQNARTRLHSRVGPNGQPPKVFIRFAHEWNGNWYPWSASNYWLTSSNINGVVREVSTKADFKAAHVRFRNLQQIHYPEAYLCMNVNRTGEGWSATADNPSGKWSDFIPAASTFDVYGVDYYNWYDTIFTKAQWDQSLLQTHSYGDPKGLTKHQELATLLGKPMSFSEWGGVSSAPGMPRPTPSADQAYPGDSPLFIDEMYNWFAANAGTGAGQVLYECYWNVLMGGLAQAGPENDKFHLYHIPGTFTPDYDANPPVTKMPQSATAYQLKWSGTTTPPPTSQPTGPIGTTWKLDFFDDFEGTAVNPNKWVVANLQYPQNQMLPLASNVTVSNGAVNLQLSTAQVSANWDEFTQTNRGAQMHSGIHNGLQVNGGNGYRAPVGSYVEARVWVPGNGTHLHNWFAFWTCGEGWPRAGEHDVLEALQYSSAEGAKAYAVYHYGLEPDPGGAGKRSTSVHTQTQYMGDAWHTYGIHRKATTADYYWDGVKVNTINTFDNGLAHAIVLTTGVLHVGGDRPIVLGAPGAMKVDWVRSWVPV